MADLKISQLTGASTPLAGTEVLPIVQSGSTVKVANNDLRPKQIQSNATSGVLQIVGPAAAATRVMTIPDANFTTARTDAAQSFTGDQTLSTGNLIQGTAGKGVTTGGSFALGLGTNGSVTAVNIATDGNLLVGTTTSTSSGVGPLVLNRATNPGFVVVYNGSEKAYQYMPSSTTYRGETVTGCAIEFSAGNSNGVSLASGGTSWGSLSDERKKDIIEPITDAANKVSALRAVIGKYKTDEEDTRRAFLIAQDVQSVLPEAVVQNENDDLILQYTEVIPLLVAAIKEQQIAISELKARLDAAKL